MKIATACMGAQISQHFGHCENFRIYEADGGKVLSEENVPNPGHRPGFLPNFLGDKGVEVVIVGGIGGGAIEIFNERGIDVITGAQGDARAAVDAYLAGTLVSTNSECHEHAHADNCGNHH